MIEKDHYHMVHVDLCVTMSWQINGSMQKRYNSIANSLELHIFCIKPSICSF